MIPDVLFGISSVVCFALPIAVILFYRLHRHASLLALMVYYVLTIFHCIGSATMPPSPDLSKTWEVLYNYLEIPLILLALLFFCPVNHRQQKVHLFIAMFVAYELAVALVYGFTPTASLLVMVPGLLFIVLYAHFLFLRQLSFTIQHGKNRGRLLMLGAIVFSYSCYLFTFYAYFFQEKKDVTHIYAWHFFSASVAAVMMSIGLYMMRHRIKQLQELKIARQELLMVFAK